MPVASFDPLSKQFDTTREEIIALMRDRISNNKRTKLTKQELEELIDIFITRLQPLDDAESIKQLCENEIALLEEGYPQATVAKNHLPKYRKAIQRAIDENRIVLNNDNSHSYTYFKDGEKHSTTEHWALTYLKYDRADYEKFAKATTANNNLKQDSLKPINKQLYLEAVSSLLESSQPEELAIAIAAVTGRRYSEVMARGDFSPTDNPYQIHFKGQLKKRGSNDENYTIYTLVPADFVLAAISRFRTHPDIAALCNASIEEINQLNTPINRLLKHYLQDTNLVPALKGEAGVTIQNLRGIYGEIAVHFFCPPNMGTHRFVQQKLGHLIDDSDLLQRKNSGSTEHYFHYYLIDNDGKQLAQKGVKLEQLSSQSKNNTENEANNIESKTQIQQLEITEEENSSSGSTNSAKPTTQDTTESSSNSSMNETESKKNSPPPVREKVKIPSLNPPVEEFSGGLNINSPQRSSSLRDRHTPIASDNSTLLQANKLDDFLTSIQTLIDSDDYKCVLVGLMASTGLDAASLLKLLVFKEAAAPHLILYCQQLHPSHQPFQQLLTLLDSEVVLRAISQIRRDRDAIDFASSKTMDEINQEVQRFIPNILESVALSPHLDLRTQYHALIPLLFKEENIDDYPSSLPVSEDTYSKIEQWQQRIGCDRGRRSRRFPAESVRGTADLDTTLNELMVLASSALSHQKNEDSYSVSTDSSSFPPDERLPWLAVSQLANTVNLLAQQVVRPEGNRQISSQSPNQKHYTNRSVSSNASPPASTSKREINSPAPSNNKEVNSSRPNNSDPNDSSNQSQVENKEYKSPSGKEKLDLSVDSALKNMSSDELRASRADGAPIEKCNRALAAVIQYNQQQEKPEDMWRINTSLLQQLTGSFNSNVKKFVKAHQKAIDEHNRTFGLTLPRHNGVHNDTDPNDLIHW